MKEFLRTLKYACIAASAGAIELLGSMLLYDVLHVDYWVSYLVALILSVLWNFTLNRKYTFKSASNVPKAMALVFAYYVVFTPASTILGNYLEGPCGWNGDLVTVINIVINGITEFLYQRFFVFRNSIDTNTSAQGEKKPVQESSEM